MQSTVEFSTTSATVRRWLGTSGSRRTGNVRLSWSARRSPALSGLAFSEGQLLLNNENAARSLSGWAASYGMIRNQVRPEPRVGSSPEVELTGRSTETAHGSPHGRSRDGLDVPCRTMSSPGQVTRM